MGLGHIKERTYPLDVVCRPCRAVWFWLALVHRASPCAGIFRPFRAVCVGCHSSEIYFAFAGRSREVKITVTQLFALIHRASPCAGIFRPFRAFHGVYINVTRYL